MQIILIKFEYSKILQASPSLITFRYTTFFIVSIGNTFSSIILQTVIILFVKIYCTFLKCKHYNAYKILCENKPILFLIVLRF